MAIMTPCYDGATALQGLHQSNILTSSFSCFDCFLVCLYYVLTYKLHYLFRSEANKYSQEELMLMKTQDIGYVLQKLQSEKKVGMLLWE